MHLVRQFLRVTLSVIAAFQSHLVCATPGQPGTLDATFASSSSVGAGKVITPIGSGADGAYAVTRQSDGKLVLAGGCKNGGNDNFCALRYNPDGTPDATFGSGGKVTSAVGGFANNANAVVVQPDGKLVLTGPCYGIAAGFCALRYNANGTLDSSFGTAGIVTTAVGAASGLPAAVALQPDGKLVLAGWCGSGVLNDFCALRYNANGTLDAGFGTNGTVVTAVGAGDDNATAIALQPDGKIVLAGYCDNGGYDFCAIRYTADGALDPTFGNAGRAISAVVGSPSDRANAVALQADGKMILAGVCDYFGNNRFCAIRYNSDGTYDSTFGPSITPIGGVNDSATAVAVQSDGKIILSGSCVGASNVDFCALRYSSNGQLDTSFASAGTLVTPIGSGTDRAYAMVVQPDGKLVLAGACDNAGSSDFCAARYDGGPFGSQNCKPDLDGDGHALATIDGLIYMRVMLGLTGNAVISGIVFPSAATRKTWPLIRDYLVMQCGMTLLP